MLNLSTNTAASIPGTQFPDIARGTYDINLLASNYCKFSKAEQSQIVEYIELLRDQIFQNSPAEVTEPLDTKISFFQPADSVHQPELFEKFSQKLVLPGRQDLGRFIMIGGLTASASPWFNFAYKLYDRCGIHTEVSALEGQDGNWRHFINATNRRWVEQTLDLCRPEDVLFALSTSGNVFAQAWAKKPGFCRAVVGIGWPLLLNNSANEHLMRDVRRLSAPITYFKGTNILKYVSTRYPRSEDDGQRCPQFTRMPVSVAVELSKSQYHAFRAIFAKPFNTSEDFNFPPVFYGQGAKDVPVSPLVREFMASGFIRSPLKHVPPLYKDGHHTAQCGDSMKYVLRDVGKFLNELYLYLNFDPEIIPDFKTRIRALDKL